VKLDCMFELGTVSWIMWTIILMALWTTLVRQGSITRFSATFFMSASVGAVTAFALFLRYMGVRPVVTVVPKIFAAWFAN